MRPFLHLLIPTLCVALWGCASQTRLITEGKPYKLIWSDEFNKPTLDEQHWTKVPRGAANWNDCMAPNPELFAFEDGCLVLRGLNNNGQFPADTSAFLTGGVWSVGKKEFANCRFEVRARIQSATGFWPAIWLLPQQRFVEYPKGGEIDIMERLNAEAQVYQTVHSYYTLNLKLPDTPPHYTTVPCDPTTFNTYGVEISQDALTFFVNNKITFIYPRIETDKPLQFPFADYPYYLILSAQLGGSWVGAVNPQDLPTQMEVDWVRVYKAR